MVVNSRAETLPRSRRHWWHLTKISPWCLFDSKSQQDRGEISSISPRLSRTRQDCWDHTEIVEISPWCSWHSKSRQDRGEISSISPRFAETSPWCLRNQQISWRDLSDLVFLLLVSQISSSSRRDFLHLAEKLDSFCILPRFWKTKTSYWDCQNITQSFPEGINNFSPWI